MRWNTSQTPLPEDEGAHFTLLDNDGTLSYAAVLELWRAVGEALSRQLGERPLWLSTAGLGVYWVHVRLDTRPKYYNHRPYRQSP